MSKSNRNKWLLLFLFFFSLVLLIPFINGLGCNASFVVQNTRLGSLYGQCEYGRVKISVNHKITKESYSASGFMGYLDGRYFIVLTNRVINAKGNDPSLDSVVILRDFYYRDYYTGHIVSGKNTQDDYIIYSSPEPTISHILLNGRFGFIL